MEWLQSQLPRLVSVWFIWQSISERLNCIRRRRKKQRRIGPNEMRPISAISATISFWISIEQKVFKHNWTPIRCDSMRFPWNFPAIINTNRPDGLLMAFKLDSIVFTDWFRSTSFFALHANWSIVIDCNRLHAARVARSSIRCDVLVHMIQLSWDYRVISVIEFNFIRSIFMDKRYAAHSMWRCMMVSLHHTCHWHPIQMQMHNRDADKRQQHAHQS